MYSRLKGIADHYWPPFFILELMQGRRPEDEDVLEDTEDDFHMSVHLSCSVKPYKASLSSS